MTNSTGPGQAVREAAARRGITLPAHVAEEAAAAALACSNSEVSVSLRVDRHQWGQPARRQDVRRKLRRDLAAGIADAVADADAVPTGPPTETLTYTRGWMPGTEPEEVPAAAAENGDEPWDHVEVRLAVPVRVSG